MTVSLTFTVSVGAFQAIVEEGPLPQGGNGLNCKSAKSGVYVSDSCLDCVYCFVAHFEFHCHI